ncbi:hypothetical protein L345_06715, partial [Ophiophagus hannah]
MRVCVTSRQVLSAPALCKPCRRDVPLGPCARPVVATSPGRFIRMPLRADGNPFASFSSCLGIPGIVAESVAKETRRKQRPKRPEGVGQMEGIGGAGRGIKTPEIVTFAPSCSCCVQPMQVLLASSTRETRLNKRGAALTGGGRKGRKEGKEEGKGRKERKKGKEEGKKKERKEGKKERKEGKEEGKTKTERRKEKKEVNDS